MNIFELPIGYTVTLLEEATTEALTAEEMAEDFPEMLEDCSQAIDMLFRREPNPNLIKAHWMLPIVAAM